MTNGTPWVSVCIPAYNRLDFLPKALESVYAQTFKDYEVVVVDDGSTDGTGDWVKRQQYPIRYFYQENQGLAGARNTLIQKARGKYIAFLDSDDLLVPDALERLVYSVGGHDALCAYGGYIRIDEKGNELPTVIKDRPSGKILERLFANIIVHSCGVLFPRKIFLDHGGFDETNRRCPDYIRYLELARDYEFRGLPDPTFKRRRHGDNLSVEHVDTIRKECELLEDFYFNRGGKPVIQKKIAMTRLAKENYRIGKVSVRSGDVKFARRYFSRSLGYRFSIKVFVRYLLSFLRRDRSAISE